MAKLKIEVQHQYTKRHGLRLFDRLVAWLPRYAPVVSQIGWMLNLRNSSRLLARLGQSLTGIAASRSLPHWHSNPFRLNESSSFSSSSKTSTGRSVVLWADTFNTYFEPENTRAARRVLEAAGYDVILAKPADNKRPLCCGRTFLAGGLIDEARTEARRMIESLSDSVRQGMPIIGLEPSCLFTLRDEFPALFKDDKEKESAQLLADNAVLFEEFLASEHKAGNLKLNLKALDATKALLHGHCHQKAFAMMGAVEQTLGLIPNLEVETVESSCCGMAGAFGYEVQNQDVSLKMAELSLLPAVRAQSAETMIVADGTSCRHQIHDGAKRQAVHVAIILEKALQNN